MLETILSTKGRIDVYAGATPAASNVRRFFGTIEKACVVSGATKDEAQRVEAAAFTALAAGYLRWDSFRVISENCPALVMSLRNRMEKTISEIREMARNEEIDKAQFVRLVIASEAEIDHKFGQLQSTASDKLVEALCSTH